MRYMHPKSYFIFMETETIYMMAHMMSTLEKDVRLKYLLDCHEDFYLPTMGKRLAIEQLYENMIQGRRNATFMLGHAPPMFNETNTFTVMEFLHSATKLNMSIRSDRSSIRSIHT